MKSVYFLLIVSLVTISCVSYSQTDKEKEDIHLKLVDFSNEYSRLAKFSDLTPTTRNEYEANFLKLFSTTDSAILVNDLPLVNKRYGKISVSQYINLLLSGFQNIPDIIVKVEEISREQIFDGMNRWYGTIMVDKTTSGAVNGKWNQINLKLSLRVALYDDEFKIISIDSPYDYDADGVPDEKDLCRLEPGLVSNSGCPDKDGDGIIDRMDMEPNSKPGVKVNESGVAKGRFWRHATFSVDFTPRSYNFIGPEKLTKNNYGGTGLWNSDYASAASFVMNNPMFYFSNHTIDLNTGFGFTSFVYYYKVVEITNANTTSVPRYNGFPIPREEGNLDYISIPLGIRLRNHLYYITVGTNLLIKHSSSSRLGWVYDQGQGANKANPQELEGDNDLTESMKNLPIAPFVELGLHLKLVERFHLKTGFNYTYINGFNRNANAGAGSTPHFIGLPETGDLNLHSLSFKLGFTYGIRSKK